MNSDKIADNKNKKTYLYVGGLDEKVNEDLLDAAFITFGDIVSITIARDDTGKSRGFGFVEFKEPDDAQAAIDNMHESELNGRTITVNIANPSSKIAPSAWAKSDQWYNENVAANTAEVDAKLRESKTKILNKS